MAVQCRSAVSPGAVMRAKLVVAALRSRLAQHRCGAIRRTCRRSVPSLPGELTTWAEALVATEAEAATEAVAATVTVALAVATAGTEVIHA